MRARGWEWTKSTKVRRFLRCHTRLESKFWRQQVWAACFVKPATHVTINVAINSLTDNYLRRLSVLCTHSIQQHVFLGRNTCGYGPSYTRKRKSCRVWYEAWRLQWKQYPHVHLLKELKFPPKDLEWIHCTTGNCSQTQNISITIFSDMLITKIALLRYLYGTL